MHDREPGGATAGPCDLTHASSSCPLDERFRAFGAFWTRRSAEAGDGDVLPVQWTLLAAPPHEACRLLKLIWQFR
ncbi:hypothetical protein Sm713_52780 [Streptomyces sp. TS71-3]|nr:hypothetical protein Sm713_52780 [Streptomyces sp. TS71-3]